MRTIKTESSRGHVAHVNISSQKEFKQRQGELRSDRRSKRVLTFSEALVQAKLDDPAIGCPN